MFTYYTQGADKTVAVMFSVPFDYNLYSNWWDVKIYNGMKRATYDMYEDMYYNHPYQGMWLAYQIRKWVPGKRNNDKRWRVCNGITYH